MLIKRILADMAESIDSVKSKIKAKQYKLVNVSEYKKGRNCKSNVWNLFNYIENEEGDTLDGYVCCQECKSVLIYVAKNGTSNLSKHKCVRLQSGAKGQISEYFRVTKDLKYELSKNVKSDIDVSATAFVACDLRPMYALEGPGLMQLLSTFTYLGSKHGAMTPEACHNILPHPTTISRQMQDKASQLLLRLSGMLDPQFKKVGGALTIDIWTDDFKKRSYMGVTAHFIDDNFKLHDRILTTHYIPADIEKTGHNLRSEIHKVMRQFKFFEALNQSPQRIFFVTYRGSNMISGLKDKERNNCYAHILNNVTEESCKTINGRGDILDTCRGVVSYIKRVGLNNGFQNGSLKMSVPTRWNTNLDMVESILINWDEIVAKLDQKNASEKMGDLDKGTISSIVSFLRPFREATIEIEASKRPTLYLVILWSQIITDHVQAKSTDNYVISGMRQAAKDYFQGIQNATTRYHEFAVFLHPLLKNMKCFEANRRTTITQAVSILSRSISCLHFNLFYVNVRKF